MASYYSIRQADLQTAAILRARQWHLDNETLPPYSPYAAPPSTFRISASACASASPQTLTTLTLTPTPTSSSPTSTCSIQIHPPKSGDLFRQSPDLKICRRHREWQGDEVATVQYHKRGGMDIRFVDRRSMPMERTGWREEAYSFLSMGGVRWWKGAAEVERARKASRGSGMERVGSRGKLLLLRWFGVCGEVEGRGFVGRFVQATDAYLVASVV